MPDTVPPATPGAASRPVGAQPGDTDLLARHVAGDREAFGILVRRHRDRLWAVALRTLGNPDDAADALQDALLSACRRAADYRGEAAVTTWLHRIVVNACLDQARRRVRAATPLAAVPDVGDPHDRFGQRETALDVTAALATLPIDQRAAVVLVDVMGYPVADAATILDVPVGTVKSRAARGRAALALRLGYLRPRNQAASRDVGHGEEEGPRHVHG